MKKRTPPTLLLLVVLLATPALAQEPLSCFGGLVRLHLPADWHARETEDAGLVLTPADEGAQVEIAATEIPRGGDPSARAAAAAYESLLFERAPYRRDRATPITSRSGEEGLLVTGRMLDDEGRTRRVTFAAFATGGRYVVAQATQNDEEAGMAPSLIGDVTRSLEFVEGAPLAGPAIAQPPAPEQPVEPAVAPEGPEVAQPPAPGAEVTVAVLPTPPEDPALSRPVASPADTPALGPPGMTPLPEPSAPQPGADRLPTEPPPLQPRGEPALGHGGQSQPAPIQPAPVATPEHGPQAVTSAGPPALPTPGTVVPGPITPAPAVAELPRPQAQPGQPAPSAQPAPAGVPVETLAPETTPLPSSQPQPGAVRQPTSAVTPQAGPVTPATERPTPAEGPAVSRPAATPGAEPSEGPAISRPAVAPAGTPEVIPAPGSAESQPALPPPVQDLGPGAVVGDEEMIPHNSPAGFTLEHPRGWAVELVGGHIEVVAPANDGSARPAAAAIIWPVSQLTLGQDPAELCRALLGETDLVGAEAATLRARMVDQTAVLSGQVGGLRAPRRVVACAYVQRDQGLLTALVARPDEFDARLPALLHVLQTFSGGPWWADTTAAAARTVIWEQSAASGADGGPGWLRMPLPEDWRASGEASIIGGIPTINIEMNSTVQPGLRCMWRQPLLPMYRELTPVLRNLGWQEGDRYPANSKDNPLRVAERLSPQDYLTKRWLAEGRSRLQTVVLDRLTVSPEVAALAGGPNAAGVVALLHGESPDGPRQRLCLLATSDSTVGGEPNCWQAAVLEAEAPVGAVAEARAVLHEAIAGAMVADSAPPAAAEALRGAISAARAAMATQAGPTQTAVKHADVLAVRNTQGRGRLWLLAPSALRCWLQAGPGEAQPVGTTMPELTADYWR